MKRWVWILVLVVLTMAFGAAGASAEEMNVSNAAELVTAMATINSNGGEYTIKLQADINSYLSLTNPTATVTLVGNGHSLSAPCSISGGTLNLGDGQSELTLIGSNTNDDPGLVYVSGNNAACNMYDKVTIKDNKSSNYLGGGVTVEQSGTFHMYGGTIRNCGVDGGSVCYGGGVAAYSGGKFIMDAGVIDGCYANTDYQDEQDKSHITATGGGVFVSAGAIFEMNGGTIQNCTAKYGGGVALAISYSEIYKYQSYGYIDSKVTINDGKIINNKSELGGGIFASGLFYAFAGALGTQSPGTGSNPSTGLYFNGGEISGNDAYDGGGIILWGLRNTENQHVQIYDTSVIDNTAVEGAGMYLGYYWTSAEIKDCVITGNEARKDAAGDGGTGGGIAVISNTNSTGTEMSGNNIICNNTAETKGADLYINNSVPFTLTSASAMNQTFQSTGITIDGWYDDSDPRWSLNDAYNGGASNTPLGDTYTISFSPGENEKGIIAAFTPYDEIEITKVWEDYDNQYDTRPDTITFTLKDGAGETVKLRNLYGTPTEEATVTISKNATSAVIGPLNIADYSTGYTLEESTIDGYSSTHSAVQFVPFTYTDGSGAAQTATFGIYSTTFTNTWKRPVTITKIWDDVNNKDNLRPTALNTQLVIGTVPQPDMDGIDVFTLAEDPATHTWTKKVYLPAKDYSALQATEGNATGYQQTNYNRSVASDGTLNFVFVNKHTLAAAATDTVRNDNMVNINYQVAKVWEGTNSVGDKQLPRPQVTVILTDDIGSPERTAVIPANADPATALFENLPKYKDNDGNEPITYTIREEITDPAWVKAGENLWYSLDGMGKYEGSITNVTATEVGNTVALGTVTGGKATNTYSTLQTTTTVAVTKLWKDHQNENRVRPGYLKLGLFKNASDAEPVAKVTLTGPNNNDAWTGTFTGLPIYDTNGQVIDYSTYVVQEAYPATLNPDGTPASWSEWIKDGGNYDVTDTAGHTYTYDYSIVTNP